MKRKRFPIVTTAVVLCFVTTFSSYSTTAQRRGQVASYNYPPQLLEEMKRLRSAGSRPAN